MTEIFAKLFDTPHGQLLVFLDETDEGEPCLHVIGAYRGGARPAAKISGWEGDAEAKAEAALAATDQAQADQMAADFAAALAQFAPGEEG